jgi:hypothetical protein
MFPQSNMKKMKEVIILHHKYTLIDNPCKQLILQDFAQGLWVHFVS